MMLIPDYHLQSTFGYQIRFRAVSSGIKNVQKYRAVLGFLKQARAGVRVENHDQVPALIPPSDHRGEIRHNVQLPLCRHRLR